MTGIIYRLKNFIFFNKNIKNELKVETKESLEEAIINVQTIILDIDRKLKIYNKALMKLEKNKKINKKYKKEVKRILKFYSKEDLVDFINLLDNNLVNLKLILAELYKQIELMTINDSLNLFNITSLKLDSSMKDISEKIQKQVDLINAYKILE